MPADVIVAGAGIIGASLAWRLAQQGLSVQLIDSGRMGGEASWAGAGMLAPGAEITSGGLWSELALESLEVYPRFVEELQTASGVAIDYRRCGAVDLAFDAEEWTLLRERAISQAALGIASCEFDPSALTPAPAVGALHYPGDAIVDPRDVMAALRVAFGTLPVTLLENCPVKRLVITAAGVEAITATSRHSGRFAVLAAGAWSSGIEVRIEGEPHPLPKAFPIRGHLLGWRRPQNTLAPILRHHHTYILQRGSGFTVAGATEEHAGFDRSVDPRACQDVAARARHLLPQFLESDPDESWVGFRPAVETGLPVIGRVAASPFWVAYGHYRNGILMAPATARRIAEEVTSS